MLVKNTKVKKVLLVIRIDIMHLVGLLRCVIILTLFSSIDFVVVRRLCCVHPVTCVDPVHGVVVLVLKRLLSPPRSLLEEENYPRGAA